MTDAEIITQLRSFFQMKGWPVLREAADRLEYFMGAKLEALGREVAEDPADLVDWDGNRYTRTDYK